MNEFVAKKLGEVLAFANIGLDTATKAEQALKTAFGEDLFDKLVTSNQSHFEQINKIASDAQVAEIVNKKLEGTGTKLKAMRDLYIGTEWDNPTELLEWSGFFEGAGIVHWQLVLGAGKAINSPNIITLAQEALTLHRELFSTAETKLKEVGEEKSRPTSL